MPLPNTFLPFNDGDTITAASVNQRVEDVERFVNGDIKLSDLRNSQWITSSEIVSPEFYGAPAPRVHLQSSDVHYRRELGGTNAQFVTYNLATQYIPIPGLSSTIHVAIPDGYPRGTVQAHIRASFFVENDNSAKGSTGLDFRDELLILKTAQFHLFVDNNPIAGTSRFSYASCGPNGAASPSSENEPMAGQNLSMLSMVELSRGVHDISVQVKPYVPSNVAFWQHTVIRHRTLNIELHYL